MSNYHYEIVKIPPKIRENFENGDPLQLLLHVSEPIPSPTTKFRECFFSTKKHAQFVEDKSKEIQAYTENSSALNEINRDMLIKSLTKKVQDSLAIKDTILPIVEEEEEVELPPLSDEQLRAVKKAFSGDPNEVLTKKFNLNVNRRDIQTLAGLNWLNDNVINFYMNLIIERGTDSKWPRAYAMNTFFYQKLSTSGPESLKRWTRKVDVFSYDSSACPYIWACTGAWPSST
jgi:sentrin-specific protease 1